MKEVKLSEIIHHLENGKTRADMTRNLFFVY